MGTLRLLLAFAVVIGHSAPIPGLPLLGAGLAVKVFFVVSGFYMALILSEKYQHRTRGRWLFYSNRFLRIFPLYGLVLLVDSLVGMICPDCVTNPAARALHAEVLEVSGPLVFGGLIFTELGLLGGELFSLLRWVPGEGFVWWTQAAPEQAVRGWRTVLLPHAWTLSCEVAFYLLAPWLNGWKSRSLLLLAGLCVGLTVLLPGWMDPKLAEVAVDFWAPLQMGFFIAGMLAWRLSKRWPEGFEGRLGGLLGLLLFGCILTFDLVTQISWRGSMLLLFALAVVGVPALFARFRSTGWDRTIGDLSYPVYLCHLLPVNTLAVYGAQWLDMPQFSSSVAFPLLAIVLSCGMAWALAMLIDKPLDAWRQRRLVAVGKSHE
jgi:peptidoglycan/LPS O-acetylase OafA/YrhL